LSKSRLGRTRGPSYGTILREDHGIVGAKPVIPFEPEEPPPSDPFLSLTDLEKQVVALYVGDYPVVLGGSARYIPDEWRDRARKELLSRGLIGKSSIALADTTRVRLERSRHLAVENLDGERLYAEHIVRTTFGIRKEGAGRKKRRGGRSISGGFAERIAAVSGKIPAFD